MGCSTCGGKRMKELLAAKQLKNANQPVIVPQTPFSNVVKQQLTPEIKPESPKVEELPREPDPSKN